MNYDIIKECDCCETITNTRKVDCLDFRHRKIEHHLCKSCDTSPLTYKKIFKRNTRLYGLGDPFGLKEGFNTFIIRSS